MRTRNVDITITNLLETYVPSPESTPSPRSQPRLNQVRPSTSSSVTDSATNNLSSVNTSSKMESLSTFNLSEESSEKIQGEITLNTSAKQFGRSATERMQSFHERKMLLIANARRKYLEKQKAKSSDENC